MPVIEKSITIQAPPGRVFAILDDPMSVQRYGPGVTDVSDIQQSEGRIGDSFKVTYSVLGLKFHITFTITGYDAGSRLESSVEGGMEGTFAWSVQPDGDSTRLGMYVDYRVKGGMAGEVISGFLVERLNAKNADAMLQNIKAMAEG